MVRGFTWAAAMACCMVNGALATPVVQTSPVGSFSFGPDISFDSVVYAPSSSPVNSASLEYNVLWSGLLYYPTFNLAAPAAQTVTTTVTISVAGQSVTKVQTNSAVFTPSLFGGTYVRFVIPIDDTIQPTNLAAFTNNLVTDVLASAHVALAGYEPGTQNLAEEPPMTSISGRLIATFDISPIPEPGSIVLLGLGLSAAALASVTPASYPRRWRSRDLRR